MDITGLDEHVCSIRRTALTNNNTQSYSPDDISRKIKLFLYGCNYIILANNQLDALLYVFVYFITLHVSSITVLIIRRSNCINTSLGMLSLCKWLLGMSVRTGIPSSHLHRLIIRRSICIVCKQTRLFLWGTDGLLFLYIKAAVRFEFRAFWRERSQKSQTVERDSSCDKTKPNGSYQNSRL